MQNDRIKTPAFTIVFPAIFTPRASAEGQEPKYSCIAVFPKSEDLTALKHLIKDAADARWNGKYPKNLRNPMMDGDSDAKPEWGDVFKNAVYVRLSSKFKPPVCNAARRELTDPESVYGGQKCVAIIHAYAYSNAGNNGVSLGLDALQVVAEGKRLGFSKEAAFAQFDQLAPADPDVTDMFDAPGDVKAEPKAAQSDAGFDPFA